MEALAEHAVCGEKLSRFYYVADEQIDALRQALQNLPIAENPFQAAFPLAVPDDVVGNVQAGQYHPAALVAREEWLALVLGSIRVIRERVILEPDELAPEVAAALAEYDEVFGIREKRHQALDVIWVPHHGNFVEVRVDYPRSDSLDVAVAAHVHVKHRLSALFEHDYLTDPVNAFPLIERIYRNPDEGTVVELAFSVPTASLKHEKMRRGREKLCLREELYHRAGSDAVDGQIDPFRLSVEWSVQLSDKIWSRPELSINGTVRLAHSAVPTIFGIMIRKCTGYADYEFVRERVCSYFEELRAAQAGEPEDEAAE
jgi:hypothetical protein